MLFVDRGLPPPIPLERLPVLKPLLQDVFRSTRVEDSSW